MMRAALPRPCSGTGSTADLHSRSARLTRRPELRSCRQCCRDTAACSRSSGVLGVSRDERGQPTVHATTSESLTRTTSKLSDSPGIVTG